MKIICGRYDEDVFSKFTKDENGKYYNERLEFEIEKRKNYCKGRGKNKEGKTKTQKDEIIFKPELTNEINPWNVESTILKHDEIWWQTEIEMKYKNISKEDIEHYLTQFWIARQKENKPFELKILRIGLQSYINSCEHTKKDKSKGKSTIKNKGDYDYTNWQKPKTDKP